MAFVTGTAANPQALYDALISFLTTNPSLVGVNQHWDTPWQVSSNERVLRGKGLANTENIYLGIKFIPDALNDRYEIRLTGLTGVIPSALAFDQHVNPCFDPVRIFLANQPMQYWFMANGRRFMAVVKVATVYQSLYAGFFLPYSPPNNYSYPLFIGGSAGVTGTGQALDWRDVTAAHSLFPLASYSTLTAAHESSAKMLDPNGQWLRCTGAASATLSNIGMAPAEQFSGFTLDKTSVSDSYGYGNIRSRIEAGLGGFILHPVSMVQTSPSDQSFGFLQGVYLVSGASNSSENIVTVSGVQHLVVQNVFRSGIDQFIAIALE